MAFPPDEDVTQFLRRTQRVFVSLQVSSPRPLEVFEHGTPNRYTFSWSPAVCVLTTEEEIINRLDTSKPLWHAVLPFCDVPNLIIKLIARVSYMPHMSYDFRVCIYTDDKLCP